MTGTSGERPGPSVLVVDDEEWMRDACQTILSAEGYAVLVAQDAASGLDLAARHRPDIVLVDIRMPGINGLEFLRRVKDYDPDVVGIVITGYATIQVALEAVKAGAFEFLSKPFEPEELRGTVRRGLDQRHAIRQTALLGPDLSSLRGVHMAVLAHQLKSPLSSLRQCAEVVLQGYAGDLPENARGMIEVIARRADQMISLVHDWLLLVRIEEGGGVVRQDSVDLRELLSTLVSGRATEAQAAGVSLSLVPEGGAAEVEGDRAMLQELFANLVTNAIKYTPRGGSVRIELGSEGAASVFVKVTDDGPGIPADEQARIFEPFYRGKAQRGISGDGLGLPISRRIARGHGGELSVKSAEGRGSEFRVVLPRKTEAQ